MLNIPKYLFFLSYRKSFLGIQKRVRNSHGKRDIGVRVIEVLLHLYYFNSCGLWFVI